MDERWIAQSLQEQAREDISDDMNLIPHVYERLGSATRTAARSRMSWLTAAVLGMLAIGVVAFAASRLLQISDPGLQGASEADLITVLNLEQTIEGVTVILDYAYADANRLSLSYSMAGEAPNGIDYRFSTERIVDSQGREFAAPMFGGGGGGGGGSSDSDVHSYSQSQNASYDLGPMDELPDELQMRVEIGVDRLVYANETPEAPTDEGLSVPMPVSAIEPIGPFVFEFTLPVIRGQVVEPEQSASVDDLTLTLNRLVVAPSFTRGELCFEGAANETYFAFVTVSVDGEEVLAQTEATISEAPAGSPEGCYDLRINAPLYDRPGAWQLSIDKLVRSYAVGTTSGGDGSILEYSIDGQPEQLAQVRARLEPGLEALGIELTAGENGLTFSFDMNGEVDQNEVNKLLFEATHEELTGPWVFRFEMPEVQ